MYIWGGVAMSSSIRNLYMQIHTYMNTDVHIYIHVYINTFVDPSSITNMPICE